MTITTQLRQEEREDYEQRTQDMLAQLRANLRAVFEKRCLVIPETFQTQITNCDDVAQLAKWLCRATTTESAAAVLDR